jgi:predicted 2-oxoglutarate/Fe(II)-dependent dioxygenase YbiX
MPHITLPRASDWAAANAGRTGAAPRSGLPAGGLFDSWDPETAGHVRVYWLGPPPPDRCRLAARLEMWEALLHVVMPAAPAQDGDVILDPSNEIARAFGAVPPCAVVVDAAGRVAALFSPPAVEQVLGEVLRLFRASEPLVVHAQAPVLLLDRVFDPDLCHRLLAHWHAGEKRNNEVGSSAGNLVNSEVKRRQDVEIAQSALFVEVRDCLVRRVAPMIHQAFHIQITVIEAPRIGCYDASSGGWFRRHRDNTSHATAHRQFALSLNLNDPGEYDGGEVRFPEFGRELYRMAQGEALVFSSSLLHEVVPVIRGRRFGLFTFLSATAPRARRGP